MIDRDWLHICAQNDIPMLGARVVRRDRGDDVALFHTGNGRVFALLDCCPHRGGPLSQGIVHGHGVTCPLHNWVIQLEDGHAVAPDVGCARAFQVRVVDGEVYLRRDELAGAAPLATEVAQPQGCSA